MTKLDDLKLDGSGTLPSQPQGPDTPSRKPWLLPVIVVLLLGAGAAWYFLRPSPPPPSPVPVAQEAPLPAPLDSQAQAQPEEPPEAIELPELDASDALLRELIVKVSSHPQIVGWLVNEDLARRFVAAMDNVAEGLVPRAHLGFMAPDGDFRVLDEDSPQPLLDPASYQRYDLAAAAFTSLDPEGTAKLYRIVKPLLQQAYQELGYPDADFDATLSRAIQRLLNTPTVEGPVALSPGVLSYQFQEPRLESLAPVQRQLLRTGPKNTRRVQAKLRELATALGL